MLDEIAHLLQEDLEIVALKPRGECDAPQIKEQAKSRAAASARDFCQIYQFAVNIDAL